MNIYDFEMMSRSGVETSLEEFKGKVILIINTATECGFTPQYDNLQDMFEKYEDDDFMILDFPCNQFANQAPGTDEEIASFCDARFGIKFPIFSKINVNGENASPLFTYLKEQQGFKGFDLQTEQGAFMDQMLKKMDPNYTSNSDIKWNFTKFLVDRDGNVVNRFEPTEDMMDVEQRIRDLL
jgi:glutathione peroxidase